jgi:sigma-B regulation protein RsbU (phosphoserine phosphatase)
MLRCYGLVDSDLKAILKQTNTLFCIDTADSGTFVTAWLALFNEQAGKLTFSNCGHHPALLYRANDEIISLSTPGMALGVVPDIEMQTDTIELRHGDLLIAFTDGVIEAHNDQMEMFGKERIIEAIQTHREEGCQQIIDALIEKVFLFSSAQPQHDDLTVIAIKYTPP